MYKCYIEAHLCNHCRNGKAISITYSEYAFVALIIQYAKHMRHIFICDLPHSTIFFHISLMVWFLKKVTEHAMCVCIFSATFVSNISHSKKNWARYDHKRTLVFTKVPISLTLMKLEFSRQIFEKYSNNKFHENLSNDSRVVPRRWRDGQTDMTKLIVAFTYSANVLTKGPDWF
jgi:hypothetical protein